MKEWFILLQPDTDMIGAVALDPMSGILNFYYQTIGCESIECVRLKHDLVMIVDEEGLIKGLDLNEAATELYILSGYLGVIVGKALIGRAGIRYGEPDIVGFETSDEAMMIADKIRRDRSARQMVHNLKKYTGREQSDDGRIETEGKHTNAR